MCILNKEKLIFLMHHFDLIASIDSESRVHGSTTSGHIQGWLRYNTIPYGQPKCRNDPTLSPIFFQHGIGGSSSDWLLLESDHSIGKFSPQLRIDLLKPVSLGFAKFCSPFII